MKSKSITAPVLLLASLHASVANAGPVMATSAGQVEGSRETATERFLGIPFAQAPIGDLRWKAPRKVAAWTGIRSATKASPACYQEEAVPFGVYTDEFLAGADVSEDCLYLNVWRPTSHFKELPVIVYIHGGGFNSGSATVPIYDGAKLAARGAVVVTVNYRLGVFGFLATPQLSHESPDYASGNYGLLDQIAALRWVAQNISAFGGDPKRVTIAGQSAGAASVNALLLAPAAKGLFQRAIAESGSAMGSIFPTLEQAELRGRELQEKLNAATPDDMRRISARTLVEVTKQLPHSGDTPEMPPVQFAPTIDNAVLLGDPNNGSAPIQSTVPLLTGFNADEALPPPLSGQGCRRVPGNGSGSIWRFRLANSGPLPSHESRRGIRFMEDSLAGPIHDEPCHMGPGSKQKWRPDLHLPLRPPLPCKGIRNIPGSLSHSRGTFHFWNVHPWQNEGEKVG